MQKNFTFRNEKLKEKVNNLQNKKEKEKKTQNLRTKKYFQ